MILFEINGHLSFPVTASGFLCNKLTVTSFTRPEKFVPIKKNDIVLSVSHKNVTQGVNVIRKSWSHQTTWQWEKFSRCCPDNGQPIYYYIYTYTCTCIYIYVKPPDEYLWQGRNSFNSGIFVILKKLWTLNYRSPLFSSQFLPSLKWLFKSSLTVLMWPLNTIWPLSQFLRIITMWPLNTLHWPSSQSLSALHCWLKMTQRRSGLNGGHPGLSPCK